MSISWFQNLATQEGLEMAFRHPIWLIGASGTLQTPPEGRHRRHRACRKSGQTRKSGFWKTMADLISGRISERRLGETMSRRSKHAR